MIFMRGGCGHSLLEAGDTAAGHDGFEAIVDMYTQKQSNSIIAGIYMTLHMFLQRMGRGGRGGEGGEGRGRERRGGEERRGEERRGEERRGEERRGEEREGKERRGKGRRGEGREGILVGILCLFSEATVHI